DPVDKVRVKVFLGDEPTPRDVADVTLTEGRVGGHAFDLIDLESGALRLELDHADALAVDNVAHAAVNVPRRARVLLVTPFNDALELALSTEQAQKAAKVAIVKPEYLQDKAYAAQAASAAYDLIIYDQCSPPAMPNCNTLFIGRTPPGTKVAGAEEPPPADDAPDAPAESPAEGAARDAADSPDDEAATPSAPAAPRATGVWLVGPKQPAPAIIDTDRAHPLMQYVELGNVLVADALPLTPPPGGTRLIDCDFGTIFAVAPRESFQDAVLGFEIVGVDDKGQRYANTDWVKRRSFPLFVMNVLEFLGGQGGSLSTGSVQPGKTIAIRTDSPVDKLHVVAPDGKRVPLSRDGQATFTFAGADQQGVYEVFEGDAKSPAQRFTVNLFDPQESRIEPKVELNVGQAVIEGRRQREPMRKELWKYILVAGLGLLMAEWWIWNRRVYL
ncbi:MAG: hypothetical protein KDA41_11255, partial [Planctomycetales bacterium]|nr:hypothetical protein [Planctomycetales bacterium]